MKNCGSAGDRDKQAPRIRRFDLKCGEPFVAEDKILGGRKIFTVTLISKHIFLGKSVNGNFERSFFKNDYCHGKIKRAKQC